MADIAPEVVTQISRERLALGEVVASRGFKEVYATQREDLHVNLLHPHADRQEYRELITEMVESGPPGSNFLWPLDLVAGGDAGCRSDTFGYVTRAPSDHWQNLFEFVRQPRVELQTCVKACSGFTSRFAELQSAGWRLNAVDLGAAVWDEQSGTLVWVECDYLIRASTDRNHWLGSAEFSAPEAIRGTAAPPDRRADLHSLAVVLFYVLHKSHPLIGKRCFAVRAWTSSAQRYMLGHEPVFIFDPRDDSNRLGTDPVDSLGLSAAFAERMWDGLPHICRNAFERAFTVGLRTPVDRVTEAEWTDVFADLQARIRRCYSCGDKFFVDQDDASFCGACRSSAGFFGSGTVF